MRSAVRSLWDEPRVPHPPTRVWREWALVAVLVPLAIVEVLVRPDLPWRPLALVLGAAPVFTLRWRRSNPLLVIAVAFGAQAVADVANLYGAHQSAALYTSAYVLLLPYSLLRWGAGREAAIGLAIIVVVVVFGDSAHANGGSFRTGQPSSVVETVRTTAIVLFPAVLGVAMRYRSNSLLRAMDRVKLREREQLARELHDTVAHHVSAIVIQAQAGRIVAASKPDAALNTLAVIEEAASRALGEMRVMVGVLRESGEPDLSPQRSVADIERLAHSVGDRLAVDVELSGDLDDLRPLVEAAIYRLAQESITNAQRHARRATRIKVCVIGGDDWVRLTVCDDGDFGLFDAGSSSGFGLMGMAERAKLLGGTLEAGPSPDRGWAVTAVLPKSGAAK
jgi:signal transduction histidine kinase